MTVAGFDPTGGAGLDICLKVSSHLKVNHVSLLSALVIQSPFEVYKQINIEREAFQEQIDNLQQFYTIKVVNMGIFGSLNNFKSVISAFKSQPIIFDPIMASGSGKFPFLKEREADALKQYFKNLYLITPNLPEAEFLSGVAITNIHQMKEAAVRLQAKYGIINVLVNGGHLKQKLIVDLLYSNKKFHTFASEPIGFNIHGSGSFLNAAIAAYIYRGHPLPTCITKAKKLFQQAAKEASPDNPLINFI